MSASFHYKPLGSHTLHACLCVCVVLHCHVSPAPAHFLTWLFTPLSSSNEYEAGCDRPHTSSMHYLANGQVADAGVLVLRPMSQWAKGCPPRLYNHLIFFWIRSVMFLSASQWAHCGFLGILPVVNVVSQWLMFESLQPPIALRANICSDCWNTHHIYMIKKPNQTSHTRTPKQFRDVLFLPRSSQPCA